MHSPMFHSSPVKDGRRVLGERTTNACLSPAINRNVDALLSAGSSTKRNLFKDSSSPNKSSLSSGYAGQKRTIDKVEGNEVNNPISQTSLHLSPSLNNGGLLQENDTQSKVIEDGNWLQQKAQHDAIGSDGSRQQAQNTASILNTTFGRSSQEISSENTVPEDPETRKLFIHEKATLLRSRIQCAMRHVRDLQFDRRLSELEAHSRKVPRLAFPTTPARESVKKSTTPPSEKTPRLEPAIELQQAPRTTSNSSGLSSPPLSAGNSRDEQVKTPTQRDFRRQPRATESPMQLSSPPATIQRGGCDRDRTEESREEHESSYAAEKQVAPSEKGDAVDGLLKLMTVNKHEALDVLTA